MDHTAAQEPPLPDTAEVRLHFPCPHASCGKWLSIPIRSLGISEQCPGCGKLIRIPTLHDRVLGVAELNQRLLHGPAVAPGSRAALDEFDLVRVETSALRHEWWNRHAAYWSQQKPAVGEAGRGVIGEASRAAAARFADWRQDHAAPLLARIAQARRQAWSSNALSVAPGAYDATRGILPIEATLPQDPARRFRTLLALPPAAAREFSVAPPELHANATYVAGISLERTLASAPLRDLNGKTSLVAHFPDLLMELESAVAAVAFSPDGRYLAACCSESTYILDLAAPGAPARPVGVPGCQLAFHPAGTLLAITANGTHLWSTAEQRIVSNVPDTRAADFTPDGGWLLVADEHSARLVSVPTAECAIAVPNLAGDVVAVSPSGEYWIVKNRIAPISLSAPPILLPAQRVAAAAFSRQGGLLGLASFDHELLLFQLPNPHPTLRLSHSLPVRCLAFSPEGTMLATGEGSSLDGHIQSQVRVWDTRSGTLSRKLGYAGPVTSVTFSCDGASLVVGGGDGRVTAAHLAAWPTATLNRPSSPLAAP